MTLIESFPEIVILLIGVSACSVVGWVIWKDATEKDDE